MERMNEENCIYKQLERILRDSEIELGIVSTAESRAYTTAAKAAATREMLGVEVS